LSDFDPYAYASDTSGDTQAAPTPAFDPYHYAAAGEDKPPETHSWLASNIGYPLARQAAKTIWALPGMAMDLGVATRDLIKGKDPKTGLFPYELPSTTFERALDAATPAPTNWLQKLSELAGSTIMGGAMPGPTSLGASATPVPANFVAPGSQAPTSGLTGAQQQSMAAGKDLGMRVTPGQETGSGILQQAEARASSVPSLSGPFSTLTRNNKNVLNATAAAGIGESGPSVDSTVLGRAADRMGDIFDAAGDPTKIIKTNPKITSQVIDAIDHDKEGLLPGTGSVRDNKLVTNLENMTGSGSVTAEQLAQTSSKLGKAAFKQKTSAMGDRDLGEALYNVKSHVDDLLQGSMPPAQQAEFADARSQYHTLMQLTKPGVVNPSTGDVSGPTLANVLQREDKSGYLFGRNQSDLYNAARFSKAFPPIGNSGTATRSFDISDVKNIALGIPGNLASWAYLRPLAPAVRAIASAPNGVQKLIDHGVTPRMLSAITTGAGSASEDQLAPEPNPSQ